MRQPIQSFKTGELGLFQGNFFAKAKTAFASFEVPAPVCGINGVIVRDRTFR
jgi:hypothetical protein